MDQIENITTEKYLIATGGAGRTSKSHQLVFFADDNGFAVSFFDPRDTAQAVISGARKMRWHVPLEPMAEHTAGNTEQQARQCHLWAIHTLLIELTAACQRTVALMPQGFPSRVAAEQLAATYSTDRLGHTPAMIAHSFSSFNEELIRAIYEKLIRLVTFCTKVFNGRRVVLISEAELCAQFERGELDY